MLHGMSTRASLLAALRERGRWDVLVIGGGATGLGTAVDAVARGFRTLLLEGADFAKGTSSRSTKLIHGGVRYLAQGNLGLVRESLHERGLLQRNAPHLVHRLGFVIPAYRWWEKAYYRTGLLAYEQLAGGLSLGPSHLLNDLEALRLLPTLRRDGLRGGVLYIDGQFDDARLAITLLRTLLTRGGTALNYLPVTGLLKENDRVSGVTARDAETGEEFHVEASAVINATGVFADSIRRMDEPDAPAMLSPSQGIHLVVDRRFQPGDAALLIPKTEDGRVLFAVPWHGKLVLGTTDTPVANPTLEPRALEEEIDFVLRTAARYLAEPPTRADVLSVFAGQRPLVRAETGNGSTAALSRDHVIRLSRSGLLTITGGKWTTYRRMGEDAIDQAIAAGLLLKRAACTEHMPLHGATETESENVFGTDVEFLRALPGAGRLLHPALTITEAQVRWAARQELARTVEDVLARRHRALFLDARASLVAAPAVATLLAEELGRDEAWQQAQIGAYAELAQGYLLR
jgi:glycerol-3-phosphate dehydrogenase